jgi:CDP-glucose 4,6-dehydratase
MEKLVIMFKNIYKNKRILVTGHTGFKGSWLVLWLKMMGAKVTGISLPPNSLPNHWDLLKLDIDSFYLDIRNDTALQEKLIEIDPEFVFHLAAQPLVRRSYLQPLETWSTNVMGTASVLNACRFLRNLKAIVIVTTDKCYENKEWDWGYREIDPIGGHDPYSASKGGAELVSASFRGSFFNLESSPLLATARAGNVIGGGDWSEDRLIPDLVRAVENNRVLEIRSPNATRPWQHVLECLSGYLILGQHLLEKNVSAGEAWNFGPNREGNRQVKQVLAELKKSWPKCSWVINDTLQLHEAKLLHLDSSKASEKLFWQPVWSFAEGVTATAKWYQAWLHNQEVISLSQLTSYINDASLRGLQWAES